MTTLINNLFIPVLAIAALTVLVAMGRLDATVAVPVIIGLTGVHIGANANAQVVAARQSSTPPASTPPAPEA